MEKRKTKKEIVKMLLNQDLGTDDEEQLIEILFDEEIAIDVDKAAKANLRIGDKVADKMTKVAGSWTFIIGFILFLMFWICLNLFLEHKGVKLDEYPFILLNLMLSCLAALQAPIIMMSQNREAKKDSLRSKNDYKIDLKSELILEELHKQMNEIVSNQRKILRELDKEEKEEKEEK